MPQVIYGLSRGYLHEIDIKKLDKCRAVASVRCVPGLKPLYSLLR